MAPRCRARFREITSIAKRRVYDISTDSEAFLDTIDPYAGENLRSAPKIVKLSNSQKAVLELLFEINPSENEGYITACAAALKGAYPRKTYSAIIAVLENTTEYQMRLAFVHIYALKKYHNRAGYAALMNAKSRFNNPPSTLDDLEDELSAEEIRAFRQISRP